MDNLKSNLIFNPNGNDDPSVRTIIKWSTTGLFNLNAVKYPWAKSMYQVMVWNFWLPEKVWGLWEDATQFHTTLNEKEQRAYKWILSFLIFLDSVQTINLPNFNEYITAPEVNLILSIQAYQEAIHSQSYATILETVVDSKERDEIYYFWKTDKHLLERNEFIGQIYQDFIDNPNDKTLFKGIVANFLLESIYFYNGFAFFDTLADQGKMLATDRMINYIRRDELCVHPDTEILTSEWWKFIQDVELNDNVAQISLDTQNLTFAKPLHKTWRDYSWKMYQIFKSGNVIQHITEWHDVVVKNISGKLLKEKIEASKFNWYKQYIQSWNVDINTLNNLSYLDRLNIAIQADWSIDTKRYGKISWFQVVHFWLTKQRKIDRLINILDNIDGIEYKNNNWVFYVKVPLKYKVYKHFEDINISNISSNYAKAFLEELKYWDWHIRPAGGCIVYVTNNEAVKDKVQSILVLSWYRNTIWYSRKKWYKDCYKINYWIDKQWVHTQNLKKETYDYSWKVWCVTMPEWTIVTRYNNFVTVQWNCHVTIFANIIKEIKNEFPDVYDEELIIDMMKTAVDQEIEWSKHIIDNWVVWMNDANIEGYTKWLANNRLNLLKIKPLYEGYNNNPYKHLDRIQDNNSEKWNFFESTITNYTQSSSMKWSWDF